MGSLGVGSPFPYFYSMNLLGRQKLLIQKRYLYLVAVLFSAVVVLQISVREQNPTIVIYARHIILFTSIYFFWALVIDYINSLIQPFEAGRTKFIQIVERCISAIILAIANLVVTNFIYYAFLILCAGFSVSDAYVDFQPYIAKSFFIRFFDIIIIGSILKVIDTYQAVQKQKMKVVTLENKLHVAKVEALRYQLDPHFLFNALHTLNTLIGYDDKRAKSMLIKVTKLLRNILEKRENQMIPFREEMAYYKSYLEIEKERFYDRLEVVIDVSDDTRDILVPTLMLQPLIENAFKHGIAKIENKGVISLKAFTVDDNLTIQLMNTIPRTDSAPLSNSTKIGLENLKNRLLQVYPTSHDFTVKKEDDTYSVSITIPQNHIQ